MQILLVSAGSVVGGLLRWAVGVAFGSVLDTPFPLGTFVINMSGSMFLGWFSTVLSERLVLPPNGWLSAGDLRLLVAVGFTGAYTTFSTYEYEAHQRLEDGLGLLAITYLVGSMVLGLLAVRAGVLLARWS